MSQDKRPSPPSPFNRTAQHDAKRAAILSEAARLFNSKGSRATTLKDIADCLGLTKTSLYYYVKTKEELIYQCYMAALERHHANLDAVEQKYAKPGERASVFLLQFFNNWVAAEQGEAPHTAALLEIASLKGEHRKQVEAQYIAMFKRIRSYLRDGMADGSIRECHSTSVTRAVLGSVEWIFFWLRQVPRDKVEETAQQALDILSNGLYAGRGEYQPLAMRYRPDQARAPSGFDREQQNRLKQEAFFQTGTWFFNKQGFNGTSLDEIAEQLNVSKGAFYYHIRNKEDLLYHCYTRSLEIVEEIHQRATASEGTGLEKIDRCLRELFYAQNSSLGPLIRYNTITALPPERRREVLERTEASNRNFGNFIVEGIADGSIRDIDPFVAQNLITGAANAAMDIGLWRRVDDIDEAARDYFDLFFNGLTPR